VTGAVDLGYAYLLSGVPIPSGQSRTIELQLFSDRPTEPFQVEIKQGGGTVFPGTAGALTFTLDRDRGQNGDTLHLTIARSASGPQPFTITARLGERATAWFGIVGDVNTRRP
jgi:hypothetical protein